MSSVHWWTPLWQSRFDQDPDAGWTDPVNPEAREQPYGDRPAWRYRSRPGVLDDDVIVAPLEAQFGQVRSRDRVRDLAEVFTHQREVDAMLDLIPDAFAALDVRFLEPACGSGNFLVEVLHRKLRLVVKSDCVSQEQYEHRLLRAIASVYGVDISTDNVTEARGRLAHVLLEYFQLDANTVEPTPGFLNVAAVILGENIVHGDTLNAPDKVELCEWRPYPGGRFQRVWSFPLVPPGDRDLFWQECVQDPEPVHYSKLARRLRQSGPPARKAKVER